MDSSFTQQHFRYVPADGTLRGAPAIRWTVEIQQGGAWPSWQWYDRVRNWRRAPATQNWSQEDPGTLMRMTVSQAIALRIFALLCASPSIAVRRIRYAVARLPRPGPELPLEGRGSRPGRGALETPRHSRRAAQVTPTRQL